MRTRHIRFEFKVQDAWIGVFWKNGKKRFDLWICLLPMVPIHYWHEIREENPSV